MSHDLPTSREWFERVKRAKNLKSAYAVAHLLGVSQQTARNWELGRTTLDSRAVESVAHVLAVDPGYVALCVAVEREHSDKLSRAMAHYLLAAANA